MADTAGIEYDVVNANTEGRTTEARPTTDGAVLARVLIAMGRRSILGRTDDDSTGASRELRSHRNTLASVAATSGMARSLLVAIVVGVLQGIFEWLPIF